MTRKVKSTDITTIKKLIYENYPPADIAIDFDTNAFGDTAITIGCDYLCFKAIAALYASGFTGFFAYKIFKIVGYDPKLTKLQPVITARKIKPLKPKD